MANDISEKPADAEKRKWRDVTLKASGYGLVAGDIAFAVYSLNPGGVPLKPNGKIRDYNSFATSLLYSMGGGIAAKYGNPKADKQLELLEAKLADHLKKNGVELPKGSALSKASLAQSGVIKHVEQFLYTYPSETLNAMLGIGGAFQVMSGKQHNNIMSKAYGWIVMAAALSGILIREIPKDAEKPKDAVGKALHWCREKPLRISGLLYLVNNGTLAWAGLNEREMNSASKNYRWKLGTAGLYAVANALMALSSKQQQGNNAAQEKIVQEIGKTGAEIASQMPKEMQDQIIGQIADFMSSQRQVAQDAPTFAAAIREHIDNVAVEKSVTDWQGKLQVQTSPASLVRG